MIIYPAVSERIIIIIIIGWACARLAYPRMFDVTPRFMKFRYTSNNIIIVYHVIYINSREVFASQVASYYRSPFLDPKVVYTSLSTFAFFA